MKLLRVLCMVTVFVIFPLQCAVKAQTSSESCKPNCGFQAVCENSTCGCSVGYMPHGNGKDCRNASCTSPDCLQCETPKKCIKCESFMVMSTWVCLKKCDGSAEIKNDSLICTESKNNGVSLVVAIVSGVACGAALSIIVVIAVCVYIHKTRRNINLLNKDYNNRQMDSGQVKQFPVYENNAYETDNQTVQISSKIDPLEYASELDKLRPHAETLMELLNQVKSKKRAMDSSDERVPTYKGVIHHLCRVLTLINKRDPVVSIPSDAMGLIQWAHQMLEDHREQHTYSGACPSDFPIAQISSVDLDNPTHPVYATPERSRVHNPFSASSHNLATPYSTVPILLSEVDQQHYGTGKRPGFATISRARAKPNSDLIRALEADLNNTGASSLPHDSIPVSQNQSNGFIREDFQNFLIQHGEKSNIKNEFYNSIEKSQNTLDKPIAINNQHTSGSQDFNFELTQKLKNRINKSKHKNSLLESAHKFQPNTVHGDPTIGSQQLTKRNIITNPNTVKKSSSLSSKHSKHTTPNLGYYANELYYDPNPMPNLDADVYAPGSNYSDHSNVMSTFLGDLARSASSSDQSEFGDDESENSGGDLDVFAFDPKDCTEPVEV